jgi:hypothetical protein
VHPQGLTEDETGPFPLVVSRYRFVLVPASLRVGIEETVTQHRSGWRGGGSGKHGDTGAVAGEELCRGSLEVAPPFDVLLAALTQQRSPAAVGIVELKNVGLGNRGRRPEAVGVHPVALGFDRTPVEGCDEHTEGGTAKLHRGREVLGHPRRPGLRPVSEGDDLLFRPAAGRQPGHGQGGTHDPEELAAGGRR